MPKFQDIKVGDRAEVYHTVTQKDIEIFARLTGDDNRIHVDEKYARETTLKRPVAHGMLGASFISTVIGTRMPGDGALWLSQKLDFHLPVRVGDELRIEAEVIKKHERIMSIEMRTDVMNQHRQLVISGVAHVKMVEVAQAAEPQGHTSIRKTALVVGGTGGIGSEVARVLASDGFEIALQYYRNETLAQSIKDSIVCSGGKCFVVRADLADPKEIEILTDTIRERLGQLTVLVNAATGPVPKIKYSDLEWRAFEQQFNINVRANFLLMKGIVPLMKPQRYGKIITISSQVVDQPVIEWAPYITGKSALVGFSKALAVELAKDGIRVNIVSPGMTETELVSDVPQQIKLMTAARTPLKRLANPADVAAAVLFLAGTSSDFLTGETIRVNGGQIMI